MKKSLWSFVFLANNETPIILFYNFLHIYAKNPTKKWILSILLITLILRVPIMFSITKNLPTRFWELCCSGLCDNDASKWQIDVPKCRFFETAIVRVSVSMLLELFSLQLWLQWDLTWSTYLYISFLLCP